MANIQTDFSEERKFVSELIFSVISEKISSREALEKFPQNLDDESLQAVWHALIHFAADEDLRKKDLLYEEVQIDFLAESAFLLQNGEALPKNIIDDYNNYYGRVIKTSSNTFLDKIKSILRFLT